MAHDYFIPLDDLESIRDALTDITDEFANAVQRSEALEAAIGAPYGLTRLRERAEDFETRWDIQRGHLAEDLGKVLERLKAVIDETRAFDSDAAVALTAS